MSFPRRNARTRRFTLGAPRTPAITTDGGRVLFLRSDAGDDPINSLWILDVATGQEARLLDPRHLADGDSGLPEAELARRERARETGEGVVAYSIDEAGTKAVAALSGRLMLVDVNEGTVVELDAEPGAFDPRLDPTGRRVAYVADGALRVVAPNRPDQMVIGESDVTWGSADFIAAEELSRSRGFWWAPDGKRLVVERVDESPVPTWHISSPTEPWLAPRQIRYPAAGRANAECSLAIVGLDDGRVDIEWDNQAYPYLVDVAWPTEGPLLVTVLDRPQQTMVVLSIDPATGSATELSRQTDAGWVEVVPGAPRWHDGKLLTVADLDPARRLVVDGTPLSPDDVQVRSLIDADDSGVLVTVSLQDPTEVHLARVRWDGTVQYLTDRPGVHGAVSRAGTIVLMTANMGSHGTELQVLRSRDLPSATGDELTDSGRPGLDDGLMVASHAEEPDLVPEVRFLELGERGLRGALLLPSGSVEGSLPVVLDPYGGPHAQRVLKSRAGFLASQWLADQGFAVLVIDGRGTPGRGPAWEREVRGDLAGPVLQDQVDGLLAAAALEPRLDLTRVGIRGWSFGGYLAALAVLCRPDVFHAAVAGAPVTDWRLYDTAYTERYLGHPDTEPENYERTDLTPLAKDLTRPLMLIHGLADDNVVVAHTLQLSRALLEAGRAHTVLPLSGVTHMTPQEAVAENLLLLQVEFLAEALAVNLGVKAGALGRADPRNGR